ncbi:hypothetical protein ACFV16_39905, partial [Streptomyces massasporeus]|uniref:hypothetical protein n=1 Tax=Streptomyces massasporeus TaxID=67324 RepID=UPI0036B25005
AQVDTPGHTTTQGYPAVVAQPPDVISDCNNSIPTDPILTYFWGDAQGYQHQRPLSCTYSDNVLRQYLAYGAPQKASADMNLCGMPQGTFNKIFSTTLSASATTSNGWTLTFRVNGELGSALYKSINLAKLTPELSYETGTSYSTTVGSATTDTTNYALPAPANKISYVQFRPFIIYSKGTYTATYKYPTHGGTQWTSGTVKNAVPLTIAGSGELAGEFTVITRSC